MATTGQFDSARHPAAAAVPLAPTYGLLLKACHPVPSSAVTVLASPYGVSIGLPDNGVALVERTVSAGQLSIGWANDLIDVDRDRATGRHDKPLATGQLSISTGRVACAVAVLGTVGLSLGCGLSFSKVYLSCVTAGWSSNLGVQGMVLSWLLYAVGFGGLPVFVALAVGSLVAASVLLLIGTQTGLVAAVVPVAAVVIPAGLAIVGKGKTPLHAAVGIAVVDVVLLLLVR